MTFHECIAQTIILDTKCLNRGTFASSLTISVFFLLVACWRSDKRLSSI